MEIIVLVDCFGYKWFYDPFYRRLWIEDYDDEENHNILYNVSLENVWHYIEETSGEDVAETYSEPDYIDFEGLGYV